MRLSAILFIFNAFMFSTAQADMPNTITVKVSDVKNGRAIPDQYAFCTLDGKNKTKDSQNMSPAIGWSGAPENARSFVILMVDKDVPKTFELANQPDKTIPYDFPRQDFYHWVLVDVPAAMVGIAKAKASNGKVPGGKPLGRVAYGINGQNDYATFMDGTFGGYDGPCPPWNDERMHHYHFMVYALDVETLGLSGKFNGRDVMAAMQGHVLAKGELMGTYTNNYRHRR